MAQLVAQFSDKEEVMSPSLIETTLLDEVIMLQHRNVYLLKHCGDAAIDNGESEFESHR